MLLLIINGILAFSITYCIFLYASFRQTKRIYQMFLFIALYLFLHMNLDKDVKVIRAILFEIIVIYKIYVFSDLIVKLHKKHTN